MAVKQKGFKEYFATFFENPTREGLRELLKDNIGEFSNIDFKKSWPDHSTVARYVLGMGNSYGGCLIIGVAEDDNNGLQPSGLQTFRDKADISKGIQRFLPHPLTERIEILDFVYEDSEYPAIIGKKFQVLLVEPDPKHLPFLATADGSDLQRNRVYVRRGTETVEASYDELQGIINRRIETGYSPHGMIWISNLT